jgi:uncharacterized protein
MTLSEKIHNDMITAVKAKESVKVEILKMVIASLKNAEIENEKELDEKAQEQILHKEVKKLKDAFEQFTLGGREDLAKKEKEQLGILEKYLPKQMEESEVRVFVEQKAKELGAESIRDMGKVMGVVMKELQGKADGGMVNNIVKDVLNEI